MKTVVVTIQLTVAVSHVDGGNVNESWAECLARDNVQTALDDYKCANPAYVIKISDAEVVGELTTR